MPRACQFSRESALTQREAAEGLHALDHPWALRRATIVRCRPGALGVVERWQEGVHARDDAVVASLSASDIEIIGPRGSVRGVEILLDWIGVPASSFTRTTPSCVGLSSSNRPFSTRALSERRPAPVLRGRFG